MPAGRPRTLDARQIERLTDLARRIDHIQGWLSPREAWELHETARRAAVEHGPDALAVEIGSWRGRSTVAIALGLSAGGGGRLISIDPHAAADERHAEVQANLVRHGVRHLVEVVRDYSHRARPLVGDATADLVFVDGDHEYAAVREDVNDWGPTLRDGGAMALNDPYWPGVRRVIAERIAARGSPFRRPRLIVNTLFAERRTATPWTSADEDLARRLATALRFVRPWFWTLQRLRPFAPTLAWRFGMYGARRLKGIYPLTDLAHYEWVLGA